MRPSCADAAVRDGQDTAVLSAVTGDGCQSELLAVKNLVADRVCSGSARSSTNVHDETLTMAQGLELKVEQSTSIATFAAHHIACCR